MSKLTWKSFYFGTAAMALLAPGMALAQDGGEKKSNDAPLGDIIITATRSETALQKTPVAVTALSSEALSDKNVKNLLDVAAFVPSLSIGGRSGTGAAGGSVSIRSMGVDATASDAAVGTYIDDVFYASDRGNLLGLMDVERVEILRGPQGTLFGRNTIAGAIQYVTKDPKAEFGGFVTGAVGNNDRYDIAGAVNIPVSDTLALRIAGMYNQKGGYVHDTFNNVDRGAEENAGGRIKALWTPNDRLTVNLKGEYATSRTNGRAATISAINPLALFPAFAYFSLPPALIAAYPTYVSTGKYQVAGYNAPDYWRFNYYTGQGTVNYDISDTMSVKSITAFSAYRSRLAQDFDLTPVPILGLSAQGDNTNVFTEELQLKGSLFSDRINYTLGAYYFDLRSRINPNWQVSSGLAPASDTFGSIAKNIESKALYGRVNYKITDKLSTDLGLRFTDESLDITVMNAPGYPLTTRKFTNVSPHIGLNYQATDDALFYVKASRGFRAGGATVSKGNTPTTFSPESAWTYEAGARLQVLDGRLRINPTIFRTEWKDIQFNSLVVPGPPQATTFNAGDAVINGFELESQFAVTDKLELSASLSLLDAGYSRVENLLFLTFPAGPFAPPTILPNITLDTPLQRSPKVKYSVGAQYTQPLENDADLVASVNYSWTDDQRSSVTVSDNIQLPSYGLLNGRLQYNAPGDKWSIAAFGTNLTDEYYLIGGSGFAQGYTAGSDELDPGRRREYGVELKVNF